MVDIKTSILSKEKYTNNDLKDGISYLVSLHNQGIKEVIIASVFKEDNNINTYEMKDKINELKNNIRKKGIDINVIYTEILKVSYKAIQKYLNGESKGINEGRYVLVDCGESIDNEKIELIYELTLKGLVPIIMHPEIYPEILERNSRVEKLKEIGCLFLLDINNIKDKKCKEVASVAKRFLNENQYQFVASMEMKDADESLGLLKRSLSKSQYEKFSVNSQKLIKDQIVVNNSPVVHDKKHIRSLLRR